MAYLNELMSRYENGITSFGKQLSCVQIPKTQLVVNSFVYEIWRHIHQRVKGSILPHNRGKMHGPPISQSLSPSLYLTLTYFLFEMQNVTAACFTILFIYLIPIKQAHISTIIALVTFRREKEHVMAMPTSFCNLIITNRQNKCA